MGDIAIRIENLSKRYEIGSVKRHDTLRDQITDGLKMLFRNNGRRRQRKASMWALKDISFEINHGEVVGIIGRNGAGKSTLLKILSRITEPTSGHAEIHGRVGSLLEVGTGFHQELTGRENIYLNGAILGMKKNEIHRKFDQIVDFAGIENFIDTPVKRYSSGMYVRLAFSVAAHLEPDVLIVDEVLSVGDMAFQKKCVGKMGDVHRQGCTVLFVSHNLGLVKSLCSRSLLLESGVLKMDGPSSPVVECYIDQCNEITLAEEQEKIAADLQWRDTGDGEGFFLYPKNGRTRLSLLCGEELTLRFDIEAPRPISEVTVGVAITSRAEEPVVTMSSKIQNLPSAAGQSRFWQVCCDMGRLPLNAGSYLAHIYVGNAVSDYARFTSAFTIQVREHDVFGWGKPLPGREAWGSVYWAPDWDIRPGDS
jgi:lipopolysaccharide transport system ATP-binding protein